MATVGCSYKSDLGKKVLILPTVPKDTETIVVGWHGDRQRKHGCRSRELAGHLITFHPYYKEESESARGRWVWREGRRERRNRKGKRSRL